MYQTYFDELKEKGYTIIPNVLIKDELKKTKVFARNVVNNFISPKVAHKQKAGVPFSTRNLRSYENKLQIEDTLRNSEIFDYFPFKKNVKNIILDPKYGFKKFLWTFYCLSRTTDNLKKIRDS